MQRQNIQAFIDFYRQQGRLEWLDELFQRQTKAGENGCILWTGDTGSGGYGRMRLSRALRSDGRRDQQASPVLVMAHRFAYVRAGGELTQHGHLDHLCRNRLCVNSTHLELVTPRENLMRSAISPARINAAKTHCPQGHEYSPDNTFRNVNGGRVCRKCNQTRSLAYHRAHTTGALRNAVKEFCPQGHEYTDANTYRDRANHRHCLACKKEYNARRYGAMPPEVAKEYAELLRNGNIVDVGALLEAAGMPDAQQAADRIKIRQRLVVLRAESKRLRAELAAVRAEHKQLCKELWEHRK